MQQLREALLAMKDKGKEEDWTRLVWRTSSRNFFNFVNKGARWAEIRRMALQIKYLEHQKRTEVKLVWVEDNIIEVRTVDSRSRTSASTDEWGLAREELPRIFDRFQVQPTVDGFASSSNNITQAFFSKIPQVGSQGVDFFTQQLRVDEVYYLCPPVKEAGHLLRRLSRFAGITAIVILPAWAGCPYWGMLRQGEGFVQEVKDWVIWEAKCQDSGLGRSLFTTGTGVRMWAGLIYTGSDEFVRKYPVNIDFVSLKRIPMPFRLQYVSCI